MKTVTRSSDLEEEDVELMESGPRLPDAYVSLLWSLLMCERTVMYIVESGASKNPLEHISTIERI